MEFVFLLSQAFVAGHFSLTLLRDARRAINALLHG